MSDPQSSPPGPLEALQDAVERLEWWSSDAENGWCISNMVDDAKEALSALQVLAQQRWSASAAEDQVNAARLHPACPACGSDDGSLGTSNAYFMCRPCGRDRYWTADHEHPNDWPLAITASPYGSRAELLSLIQSLKFAAQQREQELAHLRTRLRALGGQPDSDVALPQRPPESQQDGPTTPNQKSNKLVVYRHFQCGCRYEGRRHRRYGYPIVPLHCPVHDDDGNGSMTVAYGFDGPWNIEPFTTWESGLPLRIEATSGAPNQPLSGLRGDPVDDNGQDGGTRDTSLCPNCLRAEAGLVALRPYVQHTEECRGCDCHWCQEKWKCTCGLHELLAPTRETE